MPRKQKTAPIPAGGRNRGRKGGKGVLTGGKGGKAPQRAPSGNAKGAIPRKKRPRKPVFRTNFPDVLKTVEINEPYWALVAVLGGRERWAQSNIEAQDMETYLPMCRDPRSGKIKALFPGYLFAKITSGWHHLKGTFGVKGVIMVSGKPSRVPDRVIEGLRAQEAQGLIPLPKQIFRKGERVVVTLGYLQGHVVLYDGLTGDGRVRVLLDFMGKLVTAQVPGIEKAPSDSNSSSAVASSKASSG